MKRARAWALVALLFLAGGCMVVAVGAGAGGGIYYTKRGVEAVVDAPIRRVFHATERAFAHFGIRIEEAELEDEDEEEDEDREAEMEGEVPRRDLEVKVTLKAKGRGPTRVRVVAERSEVTWDKDFARAVLEKIVEFSR